MTLFQLVRLNGFVFLFALLCNSCQSQNVEPFPVKATKIHKDSIALRAETLPEYRNSVHDTDYQGNQISGVIRTVFQ
ncbi:MAG: hypothetical protein LRY32_01560, partial [Flavobacterium sp.]|nr:hypothetical protein [Flavobacterium sp.]